MTPHRIDQEGYLKPFIQLPSSSASRWLCPGLSYCMHHTSSIFILNTSIHKKVALPIFIVLVTALIHHQNNSQAQMHTHVLALTLVFKTLTHGTFHHHHGQKT